MNLRLPLVGSVAALIAGTLVAALVIAFCGGDGEQLVGPAARATPGATRTARPTGVAGSPGPGTPAVTGTAGAGEPGQEETRSPGESPGPGPAETPVDRIPGETPGEGGGEQLSPEPLPGEETATAVAVSPVPGAATPTPTWPQPSPAPTPTRTPAPELPDLVVRDLRVDRDRIVIVIGNDGEGHVPAGQVVEVDVRGIVAKRVVMLLPLGEGDSLNVLLQDQLLYKREKVLGRVDPNDLIPEEDDNNNVLSRELLPDVPVDLGVLALRAVGAEQHLAVLIRNNTEVPIVGADVRVHVFRSGAQEPTTVVRQTLNLDPFETGEIDVFNQVAVSGVSFRVVLEVVNLPDANLSNNTFQGTIPQV